jgi:hypothetical protein
MDKSAITKLLIRTKCTYSGYVDASAKNISRSIGMKRSSIMYCIAELLPYSDQLTHTQLTEITNMLLGIQHSWKVDCEGLRKCDRLLVNFRAAKKLKRGKGRPVGYVMSDESKAKISGTKAGHTHSEETKQKIADGVSKHLDTHPTPVMIAKDCRIMNRTRQQNQLSLTMLNWWDNNPGFRLIMCDFMSAMHEERKANG